MSIFAEDTRLLNLSSSDGKTVQNPAHFTVTMSSALPLDQGTWFVSLVDFKYWNTNENIRAESNNNIIRYSNDGGLSWKDVVYPDGLYSIKDIIDFFQQVLIDNGDATEDTQASLYLSTVPAQTTTRWNILEGSDFQVDMSFGKINELLGFTAQIITSSTTGDKYADVSLGVSQYQLRCNVVNSGGSLSNGKYSNVVYSFFPTSAPGGLYSPNIFFPLWIRATSSPLSAIEIQITDQLGREVILSSDPSNYKTIATSLTLQFAKLFDFNKLLTKN